MVGRGAHDVEPEGDVDAAVEIDGLDRDQRLVVVHADRGVVAGAGGRVEQRVGGVRAREVHPLAAQPVEHRDDRLDLLASHGPGLAGVRVEPGDGEARPGDAEVGGERPVGDPERRLEQLRGQRGGHLGERAVDRHRHHPERRGREHHYRQAGAAEVGEVLGVSGEGEAGARLQQRLGDRVGADGQRLAGVGERDGAGDDRDDGGGVARIGAAGGRRMRQRVVEHRQALGHRRGGGGRRRDRPDRQVEPGAERGHVAEVADQEEGRAAAERRPGLERDLAADPGGVAEGQRDRRGHRSTMSASPRSSWR